MITTVETIDQQELDLARAKAQRILELARTNDTFRQKISENPVEALRAFGFSESAVSALLQNGDRHTGIVNCLDLTCIISQCPDTCYVTIISIPSATATLTQVALC